MMHRPLFIGPEERARIATVIAFAARPENHYRPAFGHTHPPGGKENHLLEFGFPERPYRCIYSLTEASNQKLFRHLSVSIPEMGRTTAAPHPIACWTLATEYGFTDWDGSETPPPTWGIDLPGFCVAIIQPYPEPTPE